MEYQENFEKEMDIIYYILDRTHASIFEGIPENLDVLMWKDFCFEPNPISLLTRTGVNIDYKTQVLKEYKLQLMEIPDHYKVFIIKQRKGSTFCSFIAFHIDLFYREMHIDLLCTKPIDYEDDNIHIEKINPCQKCQSNGYATILLFASILETMKKGRHLKSITLEALRGNKTFYEKFGFEEKKGESTIKMESKTPTKTLHLCVKYMEKIKNKILEKDMEEQSKKKKLNSI